MLWSFLQMNSIRQEPSQMWVKLYFLSLPHCQFFSLLNFYLIGLSKLSPVSNSIINTISSIFFIHKYIWLRAFCLRFENSVLIFLFIDSYTVLVHCNTGSSSPEPSSLTELSEKGRLTCWFGRVIMLAMQPLCGSEGSPAPQVCGSSLLCRFNILPGIL